MYRQRVIWSPCEEDYLKAHKGEPINQLAGYLSKSRNAIKNKLTEFRTGKKPTAKKPGKRTNIGKRKDCDNRCLRSSWEANLYRILKQDKQIDYFQYECTDFDFWHFGIKKGTVSYTPDFKIVFKDGSYKWIEVKGYLKPQDKVRIRRFFKFYPEEAKHLEAVTGSPNTQSTKFFKSINVPIYAYYNELKKTFKEKISNWED